MTTTRTPTTDTKRLMATRASIRGSIEKDFSAGTQRVTDIDAEAYSACGTFPQAERCFEFTGVSCSLSVPWFNSTPEEKLWKWYLDFFKKGGQKVDEGLSK